MSILGVSGGDEKSDKILDAMLDLAPEYGALYLRKYNLNQYDKWNEIEAVKNELYAAKKIAFVSPADSFLMWYFAEQFQSYFKPMELKGTKAAIITLGDEEKYKRRVLSLNLLCSNAGIEVTDRFVIPYKQIGKEKEGYIIEPAAKEQLEKTARKLFGVRKSSS